MPRPTLSIVLCNYNHGHLIGRALDAIVQQSTPPDELIVVDDASTDDSLDVIEPYLKRYLYIHLVRNEENRGAHAASRQALERATCDFVYAGAADDAVLPGAFEVAMSAASEHPDVGIVFGPMHVTRPDGSDPKTWKARSWESNRHVTPKVFLREYLEVEAPDHSLTPSTFYRRDVWKEIGFYRLELGCWADTFAARALGLMYGAAYVSQPMAVWTYNGETLSGTARQDPHAMLDVVSRAARLMRSEPFRAYFPEDHVESWARRYRALLVGSAGRKVKRELRKRLEDLAGGPRPLPVRLLTELVVELASLAARRSLMRYRADLSCSSADGATAASEASGRSPSSPPGSSR